MWWLGRRWVTGCRDFCRWLDAGIFVEGWTRAGTELDVVDRSVRGWVVKDRTECWMEGNKGWSGRRWLLMDEVAGLGWTRMGMGTKGGLERWINGALGTEFGKKHERVKGKQTRKKANSYRVWHQWWLTGGRRERGVKRGKARRYVTQQTEMAVQLT